MSAVIAIIVWENMLFFLLLLLLLAVVVAVVVIINVLIVVAVIGLVGVLLISSGLVWREEDGKYRHHPRIVVRVWENVIILVSSICHADTIIIIDGDVLKLGEDMKNIQICGTLFTIKRQMIKDKLKTW